MRAMLLEMNGYRADILEFVSSRYTDKNVMIRAVRDKNIKSGLDITEYDKIKDDFRIQPELENYLKASG